MRLNDIYQKYNPFRRVDWRWERVLRMVDRQPSPGRATRRDDDYIRQARNFVLRWRAREEHEREEMFYENPGLFLAYQMFEKQSQDADHALYLQGRLLADMSTKVIADAMTTLPQMVEWYEALFFNVSDRLKARDWITKQVLVPAMVRNFGLFDPDKGDTDTPSPWHNQVIVKPFMDASLKMFAYYGGPVLCEFMIAGFQQGKLCQSPDALAEWLDGHWALTMRARSAQAARTFEVNKYNVMELFATHTRIMEIEKSAEGLDSKRTNVERHVGALIDELEGVWTLGEEEDPAYAGTDVPRYDEAAAELRDDELLRMASGHKEKLDGLEQLSLPPPSVKKGAKKDGKP